MSQSPFCFVHATNVRLDQPMWGIGAVSGEARRLVEEATNLAFSQIVEICIQQQAAFLLLTGNTIDAAHGYRARVLLEQACERLARHECQVFLMPGQSDPPQAWGDDLLVPENLTVFLPNRDDPVSVTRDSHTLATIAPYQDRQHSIPAPGETGGLRVGLIGGQQHRELQQQLAGDAGGQLDIKRLDRFPNLVSFNYLALGQGSERITVTLPCGLAHDPGCPQPLDGRQTLSLGCTLIDVDQEGQMQTRLMPTAVVRREEIEILVESEQTWDDLVDAMRTAVGECEPLLTEQLWLIRWIIEGAGSVISSLHDASARNELAELVESELADHRGVLRCHEIDVTSRSTDNLDITEAGSIYEEFQALIHEHASEHLAQFRKGLPGRDWPESPWVRDLIEAAEQATETGVHKHTQALARRHLSGNGQEAA